MRGGRHDVGRVAWYDVTSETIKPNAALSIAPPPQAQAKPRGDDMSEGPTDEFLIAGMLGGDTAAMSKLIDRYDRLVRFSIFKVASSRCRSDPQWLDGLASEAWTGFVQAMRRDSGNVPDNLKAYLVRIARNRAISAMRGTARPMQPLDGEEGPINEVAADEPDPSDSLEQLELLEALRGCLETLDGDSRQLADHLEAITQRRWKQAASALGIAESTLRSRWKIVLEELRGCVSGKTGISLARGEEPGD
ncbi:MAG: RNA polymerase sigma factor [Planctomycetota bacterium]|jgi:RNA polymerase sigma factor (sigma-70 family)